MKDRPSITPYMSSADENVNASISLGKIYGLLRRCSPDYKPTSRYQMRLMSKRAVRRLKLHAKR